MYISVKKIKKKFLSILWIKYQILFIKKFDSKAVITFDDNILDFYLLKKSFKNKKFICVQQGVRAKGEIFDILKKYYKENKERLFIDLFFVFGKGYKKEFEKYIDSKYVPIGSFLNNHYKTTHVKKNKRFTILFISQYVHNHIEYSGQMNAKQNQIYNYDRKILNFISDVSKKNNFICKILPRKTGLKAISEEKFFKSLLKRKYISWEFIKRNPNIKHPFTYIDKADLIIFMDSTLGYEAIARKKKCLAFGLRGNSVKSENYYFGWPLKLKKEGLFWSNNSNKMNIKNFEFIVNKIKRSKYKQIKLCYKKYLNDIILYDRNNSKFQKEIKKIKII